MLKPQHINATRRDMAGNHGLGRYVMMTGSDFRAREISLHFSDVRVLRHERHHDVYLGRLETPHGWIDVASVSSGMGGSSADIIINELLMLGVKRILRIGTAGALQPKTVHVGDLVLATAAVRDDKASWDYIYPEYPAISSLEYIVAALRAVQQLEHPVKLHTGIVHSKSSLYAREAGLSLLASSRQYMKDIKHAGVIASEMECAQLFVLASLANARVHKNSVLTGAILAVVGDVAPFSQDVDKVNKGIHAAMELGIKTTIQMSLLDRGMVSLY